MVAEIAAQVLKVHLKKMENFHVIQLDSNPVLLFLKDNSDQLAFTPVQVNIVGTLLI